MTHPKVEAIQQACAKFFGVQYEEVVSAAQGTKSVTTARRIAMYLARKMTVRSYPELGEDFRRHYTTVLVTVRRVAEDPNMLRLATKIEESIT